MHNTEEKIVKSAINELLEHGFSLSINNGGDENEIEYCTDSKLIFNEMDASGEDYLIASKEKKSVGYIYFVFGNEPYFVISDYTVGIGQFIPNTLALAESLES